MSEEEIYIVKSALDLLNAAGGTGVLKSGLLGALRKLDGRALTPEEKGVVWDILTARGWIDSHVEPLWHNIRWSLTPAGATAREAL